VDTRAVWIPLPYKLLLTKHFYFLDLFLRVIVDRIIKILHVRIIIFLFLRNCYNNGEVLATADINCPELGK